jgi:hypothetical protein
MTILAQPEETDLKCLSFSKSRARFCLAYGRYECKQSQCKHRSCGLHVIRNNEGIYCPQCGGPVRTAKH